VISRATAVKAVSPHKVTAVATRIAHVACFLIA
jgi:hypothetical protein